MIRYKVLDYSENSGDFRCEVSGKSIVTNTIKVDLLVNGDFPQGIDPKSLVGNTYEAEYDFPVTVIAMNVNPIPTTEPTND